MINRISILTVAALLITSMTTLSESTVDSLPVMELKASVTTADFEGYMQTPTGGKPGTSDIERPTLKELNIDDSPIYDLILSGRWAQNTIYGGIHLIQLTGSGVLAQPLITRRPFPADTAFDAEVNYDWYQVGYARWFQLPGTSVMLAPQIEVAMLDFHYKFDVGYDTVNRDYSKIALRAGIQGLIPLGTRLSLSASIAATAPISNTPQITTGNLTAQYSLFSRQERLNASIFAGIGMLYIDYEDNQELPNHLRFEAIPNYSFGLLIDM